MFTSSHKYTSRLPRQSGLSCLGLVRRVSGSITDHPRDYVLHAGKKRSACTLSCLKSGCIARLPEWLFFISRDDDSPTVRKCMCEPKSLPWITIKGQCQRVAQRYAHRKYSVLFPTFEKNTLVGKTPSAFVFNITDQTPKMTVPLTLIQKASHCTLNMGVIEKSYQVFGITFLAVGRNDINFYRISNPPKSPT